MQEFIQICRMEELFVQFLWRHQHSVLRNLKTSKGERVIIHFPGIWNSGPGPDFLNAKVEWEGVSWNGHVEIHLNSKDWYRHRHHKDETYNAVILHVVLEGGVRIVTGKQIGRAHV